MLHLVFQQADVVKFLRLNPPSKRAHKPGKKKLFGFGRIFCQGLSLGIMWLLKLFSFKKDLLPRKTFGWFFEKNMADDVVPKQDRWHRKHSFQFWICRGCFRIHLAFRWNKTCQRWDKHAPSSPFFCWNFKKSHRSTVLCLEIRCFLIEIPMGPAVFVEKNADTLESEDLDQLRSAEITGRILTTWHGEEYRKSMQGGDGWQARWVLFEDSAGLILLWWDRVKTETAVRWVEFGERWISTDRYQGKM